MNPLLGDVILDAEKRFDAAGLTFGHGTDNAFDEAAFIVMETLGIPLDADLNDLWQNSLNAPECAAVEAMIAARITTRKPASYLLNKAYMHGFPFYVDERVIVPRSFIGDLLLQEDGFDPTGMPENVTHILDLCTGSGCLAILAAHVFPEAQIDAVDLSPDALAVAKHNVADYGMEDRITLYEGDLFTPLGGKSYDLIITNPPYVDAEGMNLLTAEYRHEPEMALASGADGLEAVRRILAEAPRYMSEKSGLLCEVGRGQENITRAFPNLPLLWLDTEVSTGEVFWITRRRLIEGSPV